MRNKYAIARPPGATLPDRKSLIERAWGDVPVSYIQDNEVLSECTFIDLKINKWETNSRWRAKQDSEPWIRVEILRGAAIKEFLGRDDGLVAVDFAGGTLVVLELDEGGNELDDMLLFRLVSVLGERCDVYRWTASTYQKVGTDEISRLPTQHSIRDRLLKCE